MLTLSSETNQNKEAVFEGKYGLQAEEMFKAGLHIGHIKSKWNPKMAPYLFGTRDNFRIIDIEKSLPNIEETLDFISQLLKQKKKILIIGTRIQDRGLVKSLAESLNMPYINRRWVGGLFTNFGIVKKRILYFRDLEEKKQKRELQKYTKKEQSLYEKRINHFNKLMGGIKNLNERPDAVFVFDPINDIDAVNEARKTGIKIIAIANTNANPDLYDYFIPANNSSLVALKYIIDKISQLKS